MRIFSTVWSNWFQLLVLQRRYQVDDLFFKPRVNYLGPGTLSNILRFGGKVKILLFSWYHFYNWNSTLLLRKHLTIVKASTTWRDFFVCGGIKNGREVVIRGIRGGWIPLRVTTVKTIREPLRTDMVDPTATTRLIRSRQIQPIIKKCTWVTYEDVMWYPQAFVTPHGGMQFDFFALFIPKYFCVIVP